MPPPPPPREEWWRCPNSPVLGGDADGSPEGGMRRRRRAARSLMWWLACIRRQAGPAEAPSRASQPASPEGHGNRCGGSVLVGRSRETPKTQASSISHHLATPSCRHAPKAEGRASRPPSGDWGGRPEFVGSSDDGSRTTRESGRPLLARGGAASCGNRRSCLLTHRAGAGCRPSNSGTCK